MYSSTENSHTVGAQAVQGVRGVWWRGREEQDAGQGVLGTLQKVAGVVWCGVVWCGVVWCGVV